MIKNALLELMGEMPGPPSFAAFRSLLAAEVLAFPENAVLPTDPDRVYGKGWQSAFRLPRSPVGIEDSYNLVLFEDTQPGAAGLAEPRKFLFVQPLPAGMFPVDFYLAWGTVSFVLSAVPLKMNAAIAQTGEWFIGKPGAEFTDAMQMASAKAKGEAMIGPSLTTAIEQLAYLAHA